MKHLLSICLIAVVGVASVDAFAQDQLPAPSVTPQPTEVSPTPPSAQPYSIAPSTPQAYPQSYPQTYPSAPPLVLYQDVRVKDACNIHPCAVPTIVEVPDPCNRHCTVCIEICAPPCACLCVKRHGLLKRKVRFDYGKYQVDVVSRGGRIVVDYDA